MNLRIPYPPARGAQGGAIGPSSASASAAAPAAASDAFGSVNRRRFFVELDASAVALVLAPYNEQELQVTQLPTDWLVDAPPDELVCCICTNVAWQAPNLQCAHLMCVECIHKLRSSICPQCRVPVSLNLQTNSFVQAMVWRLRVKCRQNEIGCDWTGELGVDERNLKAHDAACPLKLVNCNQCDQPVKRCDIKLHRRTQCPQRFVRCESCLHVVRRSTVAAHFNMTERALEQPRMNDASVDEEQKEGASADAEATSASSALKPPFIPPCVNMEACPNGCEDPAHPGHVLSYSVSNRARHQAICPLPLIQCLVCKPLHSLPDSELAAHIETLFL